MADPIDEYLARQKAFDHRIAECRRSIAWYKRRTGLARHTAREKIRQLNEVLEQLTWMKDEDSLPWGPRRTFEMDPLAIHYLTRLDDE